MSDAQQREREAREVPEAISYTAADPRIEMVPESGCWVWMGRANDRGYARLSAGQYRHKYAHTAFWETANGPVPKGMVLDHTCRVKTCVNPSHVRAATPRQNALENSIGNAARNAAKTHCPKCGGGFTRNRQGRRVCVPCHLAACKRYYENVKKPKIATIRGLAAPTTEEG